jgi:ferredoxin
MKFQVEIDNKKCVACAKCYTIDREHFENTCDGKAKIRGGINNETYKGNFGDGKLLLVHEAESACPVSAIKIIWESELWPEYPNI